MPNMWYLVRAGVLWFLNLVQVVLMAYCVLSWFANPHGRLMHLLTRITDPILHPIRALFFRSPSAYRYSGFAPLIAVLVIQMLSRWLMGL